MKLRRTLSAAAATAALVPAAVLTATAARADGGSSASPSASASSPAASASAAPSSSAIPSSPAATSAPSSPSASPTASPTPCHNGPSSKVHFKIEGLPSKIAAGSGWHTFTMNVANTSSTPVGAVEASVSVNNGNASENADLWAHAYLEYWDAGSSKWLTLKDEGKNQDRDTGIIFGYTNLDANESADLKFRLEIDADATPGDSYATGGGTYVEPEKNCTDGTTTEVHFDVLAPGEQGGGSGTGSAEPTPSASTSQGGTSSPSATGNLAETGSSSALPAIAAVGGLAVVAGAGAVFMMRRRRNGSAPV
ncbi:LAETG motif-containing sortase-dependent surface protein [Streptomyces sp. NPDC002577]